MRPQRNPADQHDRMDRRVLLAIAAATLGCALALLAYVTAVLRTGSLDARPKHAPATEPWLLYAAEEPFWFYSIAGGLAVLALYLLVLSRRMVQQVWQQR